MNVPTQTCPQCGAPLASGQTFCGNCGNYIEIAGSNQGKPAAPSSVPPAPPSYENYSGSPYGNTSYGGSAGYPPPPPLPGTVYSAPSSPSYPPAAPPSYGTPATPGAYPYPPSPTPSPSPYPPQQPPRTGLSGGLIALIILAVVLLLGGGGLLLWSSVMNNPGKAQVTPTPSQPGTPTPTAVPTPQALFSDNFADNHNNWDTFSKSGVSVTVGNNMLSMKEANHKFLLEDFPQSPPADAMFTLTLTMTQGDKNDLVGLLLRSPAENQGLYGYYIAIYGDNSYDIEKYYPDPENPGKGKVGTLLDFTTKALRPQGQQNQLTVIIKGTSITLLVNNQLISTVKDVSGTPYLSGKTRLFAGNGNTSTGTGVNFHSIAVYPAPDKIPA
ncbi:MAG: hypothetical protein IMW89_19615 [Ktedonobacteraceae bacterium]|nr:hypothetical protein [Ktedonobacteraceae bacterium]